MDSNVKELLCLFDREIELGTEEDFKNLDELLNAIEMRVEELMSKDVGLLFSYLYRLDVSEKKVREVLSCNDDACKSLSKLILERQLQRLQSKKSIRQDPIEGWEW